MKPIHIKKSHRGRPILLFCAYVLDDGRHGNAEVLHPPIRSLDDVRAAEALAKSTRRLIEEIEARDEECVQPTAVDPTRIPMRQWLGKYREPME